MTTTTKTSVRSRPRSPSPSVKHVGVALYGYGTVGSALARIIAQRSEWLAREHALAFALKHVAVRDLDREREPRVARTQITRDCARGLRDPSVNIVVELIGGSDVALDVAHGALAFGKHLVTANKAVIAEYGAELEALAARERALLRYEGAVGGAIPILRVLRTALATDRITRVRGIINGTTNYILTRMDEDGLPFFRALGKAGALGFAEADPTADVSGADAAHKLTILARHAFGRWLPLSSVTVEGIEGVSLEDFRSAREHGCTLKLIADADARKDGVTLRVGVEAVARTDSLAAIRDELNAIQIEADNAGPILLTGRGAGGAATASAVYADLVEVARATMGA
jgi:homoserine dehydrogenase